MRMGSNPISCNKQVISPPWRKPEERLREDGRAVKARDSSSREAILVGSNPTPRIRVSSHPLQVEPLQFWDSAHQKLPFNRLSSEVERVALNHSVEGSIPSDGEIAIAQR